MADDDTVRKATRLEGRTTEIEGRAVSLRAQSVEADSRFAAAATSETPKVQFSNPQRVKNDERR